MSGITDDAGVFQPFEYAPISATQLRLLSYAQDSTPDHISLGIRTCERKAAPPYIALSYRWAEPDPRHAITLNGCLAFIWPNLWYALSQARRTLSKAGNFWIDSLCINQKDPDERSRQVSLMDQTFSNAIRVAAWLGPLQESTRPLFERDVRDLPFQGDHPLVSRPLFKGIRKMFHRLLRDFDDALTGIAVNPYFTRVWVIQEILLAKEVVVCSGQLTCPLQWCYNIAKESLKASKHGVPDNPGLAYYQLTWTQIPRRFARLPQPHPVLGDCKLLIILGLFFKVSRFDSTDPRDKVFAIQGMLSEHETQIIAQYLPDYRLSIDRVIMILLVQVRALHVHGDPSPLDQFFNTVLVTFYRNSSDPSDREDQFEHRLEAQLQDFEVADLCLLGCTAVTRTADQRKALTELRFRWASNLSLLDVLDCFFLRELAPENLVNIDLRDFDFAGSSGEWVADGSQTEIEKRRAGLAECLQTSAESPRSVIGSMTTSPGLLDRILELGNFDAQKLQDLGVLDDTAHREVGRKKTSSTAADANEKH